MNRSLTLSALLLCTGLLVLPSAAMAAFTGPTSNQGADNMSVDKVLGLKFDREHVCMNGRIINKIASEKDKYTFQDMTGSMIVEIDLEVFRGQNVTPETKIRICGEVDAEAFKQNEFDAEYIEILR